MDNRPLGISQEALAVAVADEDEDDEDAVEDEEDDVLVEELLLVALLDESVDFFSLVLLSADADEPDLPLPARASLR